MGQITINRDKCKGCYICIEFCPQKMIEKDASSLNVGGYYPVRFNKDKGKCTSCAICAQCCPDIAISEVIK